jgi:hypothetical protein
MNKFLILFTALIVILGGSAAQVHAARVTFDAGTTRVGTGSVFPVEITIDATLPVNAITLVIPLPSSVELVGASDANSIVSMWVEKPALNSKHEVVMSGLIPGGFTSEDGKLVTLHLQSATPGPLSLAIAPGTTAYLHSETGEVEAVTAQTLNLTLTEGVENTPIGVDDTLPPEKFVPVYVQVGEGDEAQWAVGFGTQDKGSGVKEYFVAESRKNIREVDTEKLSTLSWRMSNSPAILEDQGLKSYVYVKAVDINGNERIAQLAPGAKWYERPIGYILIGVLLIGVLYAIFFRKNKSHRRL